MKKLGRKDIKLVAKTSPTNPGTKRDREYIAASGIGDQIIYFQDITSPEEVALMMKACDVYAAPSHGEGFGRPHVEAQACGKPVLTIDANAARENVIHGETGYVAKVGEIWPISDDCQQDPFRNVPMKVHFNPPIPGDFIADVDDVARGLELLLDPGVRLRMGATARQYVLTHFDTMVIARQFQAVMEQSVRTVTVENLT